MTEIKFPIIKEVVNVLIIDDHKMVRDGLKIMLNSLKDFMLFKIQEAESGEEAITTMNNYSFEIVIIDYQMPGISGPETVYRMLRINPQLKILALSNYDELAYIQNMMDAGARGYILKNIEPAEMLNAIKTILSNKIYYCNDVAIKLIESTEDKNAKKIAVKGIFVYTDDGNPLVPMMVTPPLRGTNK